MVEPTWDKMDYSKAKLKAFLKDVKKKSDILLEFVQPDMAHDFYHYLRTKHNLQNNSAMKYIKISRQVIFNTYIRLRDKGKSCISCNKRLTENYDAGHFYTVKNYSFLRFNEDNVHGQCGQCNQHLHGNLVEYSRKLKLRIGEKKFIELEESRHKELLLTKEEIQKLIARYKLKIKEIQSIKNPTG